MCMYKQAGWSELESELENENKASMLDDCLFCSCAKLARSLGKLADESFQKLGLSPSHALLLYVVNQRNGICQKEAGELLHLMPSTVTRFVEKLEIKRLVDRKGDGKNVLVYPTEAGVRMQPDILHAWNHLHGMYADVLTPEEHGQFIAICNKLMHHLESRKGERRYQNGRDF